MNENRKIPELRFPEYTDDWKDYRIGELFDERREKMPDGELLSVTIKDGIKKHSESGRRDSSSDDKSNYKKVCVGDIAYNSMRMWQGASGFSEYEGIISPAYTVIKPKENVDARCAAYLFKRKKMTNIFQRHSQGVASDTWNLKYPELSQIHIMFPRNVAEQHRISSFFSKIDSVIALQQQYVDQLKEFKKGCLQKMFPKKGEKVPEMRFPGFTDYWEQRKLGDIVERITRKNENLESILPLTISAQYGLIDQNEFFDKRIASKDVSGYYLVRKGEFAYNKSTSSDAPWGAIKRLDRYESGVLSTLYIVFRILDEEKIDSDYLVTYYDTDLWHKGVQAIAAEGARNHGLLNIAPADFFETTVSMPQDIEEQRKIGAYFKNLDCLITLHQRKLDEMKEFKKGCLQKMFV